MSHPLFPGLPAAWQRNLQPSNNEYAAGSGKTIVVLDDDPTGTQTVYNTPVVTTWDEDTLVEALTEELPLLYILTNTRALPPAEAASRTREIATALGNAAAETGREITLISRGDSTLRGHFPLETDVLAEALHLGSTPLLLIPFFEEGGRLTSGGTHYVVEGDTATPVAETPFARDPAFGFTRSDLPGWVEEKTAGKISADEVVLLSLDTIRKGGPEAVARVLAGVPDGAVCAVNAVAMRDLEVVAAAIYATGKNFLYRTAASWVRALAGIPKRPLCTREDLSVTGEHGGLVVAGSYVPKTTVQLEHLKAAGQVGAVELDVGNVLDPEAVAPTVASCASGVDTLLRAGKDAVLFTSREHVGGGDAAQSLLLGKRVSQALCAIVRQLTVRPRYILAKGGITANDIATGALGVRRAQVRGQILPGVPVWQLGKEATFPGLDYIVFPGNVGGDSALTETVNLLAAP